MRNGTCTAAHGALIISVTETFLCRVSISMILSTNVLPVLCRLDNVRLNRVFFQCSVRACSFAQADHDEEQVRPWHRVHGVSHYIVFASRTIVCSNLVRLIVQFSMIQLEE